MVKQLSVFAIFGTKSEKICCQSTPKRSCSVDLAAPEAQRSKLGLKSNMEGPLMTWGKGAQHDDDLRCKDDMTSSEPQGRLQLTGLKLWKVE